MYKAFTLDASEARRCPRRLEMCLAFSLSTHDVAYTSQIVQNSHEREDAASGCQNDSNAARQRSHDYSRSYVRRYSSTPWTFKLAAARLAQSAERKALNLVVVGSSPTVGALHVYDGMM